MVFSQISHLHSSSKRFKRASSAMANGFLFVGGASLALSLLYAVFSFLNPNALFNVTSLNFCYNTRLPQPLSENHDPIPNYPIEKPLKNWDAKRREWLKRHPSYVVAAPERILIVTGSQPSTCSNRVGDHLLLRLFKNKVDYCRIHGHDIFYNNALLHPKMTGFWAKYPVVRAAMLAHPETEWIWWVDSDAIFTDMNFTVPFEKYKNYNLVVDGYPDLIYEKKSWTSLNAGIFLIRNCQWSITFMEVWARMGPQSPDFESWGRIQKSTFKDKTFPASDDQSALVYLLLKQKNKWADKIYLEHTYDLHGYWLGIVDNLENGYTGNRTKPFITHFTGCVPCSGRHNPLYTWRDCWEGMEKALNFADNQVLRRLGYVHPDILNTSSLSPLRLGDFEGTVV